MSGDKKAEAPTEQEMRRLEIAALKVAAERGDVRLAKAVIVGALLRQRISEDKDEDKPPIS